jgi:hypothetical protein
LGSVWEVNPRCLQQQLILLIDVRIVESKEIPRLGLVVLLSIIGI